VTSLVLDTRMPSTIYVGGGLSSLGEDLPTVVGAGAFRSEDGGASWTSLGFDGSQIGALTLDEGYPAKLVAAVAGVSEGYPVAGLSAFYRTANRGQTWTVGQSTAHNASSLTFAGPNSNTLFAKTCDGILKSVDGGAVWLSSNGGIPSYACLGPGPVVSHPVDPAVLFVTTDWGVFKTTDGGVTWAPAFVAPSSAEVWSLAIDPISGSTLYAGTAQGGVYVSRDGAQSWTLASAGIPSTAQVQGLAIDPRSSMVVYAGTDQGVFRSIDGGTSWASLNDGLTDLQVSLIAVDPLSPSTIYAGTKGNGVFSMTVPDSRTGPCELDSVTLCLGQGRFSVRVLWDTQAASGNGRTLPLTSNTGAFWFFDSTNLELVVKVLDGRSINGHFWVFYGSLTNVEFTLTVTDTQTGAVRTYTNPQGTLASVADTSAF